jgi:hypothetical protein
MVINFANWGGFVQGVGGPRNLCCNWVKFYVLHRIGVQFPHKFWFGSKSIVFYIFFFAIFVGNKIKN